MASSTQENNATTEEDWVVVPVVWSRLASIAVQLWALLLCVLCAVMELLKELKNVITRTESAVPKTAKSVQASSVEGPTQSVSDRTQFAGTTLEKSGNLVTMATLSLATAVARPV